MSDIGLLHLRVRRPLRIITAVTCAALALASGGALAQTAATGLQQNVTFTAYSPLATNSELSRRLLTPLTAAQIPQRLAQSGKTLGEQPIQLADERFVIYAPPQAPPGGYALLVFIPPWPEAKLPTGWAPVLDRYGVIYVSAARSGNDASPLARREPLALLEVQNVASRYKVDPSRIFIGGFSGGSRVAMRLALGYPDVFRGAFLNAGADPIGSSDVPLPPKDLFQQFQDGSHLVYITGDMDAFHLDMDSASLQSMRRWCVLDISSDTSPNVGHELANGAALSRALQFLAKPQRPDPAKLAACRAGVQADLDSKMRQVETLMAAGKRDEALGLLSKVDGQFGGLAAPRSLDLSR